MSSAERHSVALRFRDGVVHSVAVDAGTPLLDAALAAGAPVLHQCRSGSCCSCAARLVEGTAEGAGGALLPSERHAGMRLLCQTVAASDCAFELGYDSRAAGAARPVRAFIDALDLLGGEVMRLALELADGDWLDFRPGQFVQVRVPGTDAVRRYSMSSTPAQLPKLELLVRLLPTGAMSDYLRRRARVEDVLDLEGPFGAFFHRPENKGPHVMIAGGTGLAPVLSIIDSLRARPGRKPPVVLSFGCADPDTLFYRDELALRRHWMPTLDLRRSVDRGRPADDIRLGNPVEAVTAEDVADPSSVAYLCGPPSMVSAGHAHLTRLGMGADRIFAEQFVASA